MNRSFPSGQEHDLRQILQRQTRRALEAVKKAPADELRFSVEAVVEEVVERFLVNIPRVDWGSITRSNPEETTYTFEQFGDTIIAPAHSLDLTWPYSGDMAFFTARASTYTMAGFNRDATISRDTIKLTVLAPELTPETVISAAEKFREDVDTRLSRVQADVDTWIPEMRTAVTGAADRRRIELDKLAALDAALEIPLKHASSPDVHVPVTRRKIRPTVAPASPATSSEPAMSKAIYEDVISTIVSFGAAAERLPRTASVFGEVGWRDLILFVLNANYEGAARGEVFNGDGKTDILLPWGDRNVFVGECKVWEGPKAFTDAIDQLLGYLVWRDTKAALILFIKNGKPTEIIEKADKAIKEHPSFLLANGSGDETRHDYLMNSTIDLARKISVAFIPVVIQRTTANSDGRTPS